MQECRHKHGGPADGAGDGDSTDAKPRGQHIGAGGQFIAQLHQAMADGVGRDGDGYRNEQQQQYLSRHLLLVQIGVQHDGDIGDHVEREADVVQGMEGAVLPLLNPCVAHPDDRQALVKQWGIADGEYGQVDAGADEQRAHPERSGHLDPAQAQLAHRDEPWQEAAADIDDLQQ